MQNKDARPVHRREFAGTVAAIAGSAFVQSVSTDAKERAPGSSSGGRVRFGKTDLIVSRYCQGTAFRQVPRSDNPQARRILQQCLSVGINFFDSAEAYGWGGSETVLGKAIRGKRDKVVICTKAAPSLPPAKDPNTNKFKLGQRIRLTRQALQKKCEGSLKRLKTDFIDLYLVHSPDKITPPEEMVESMNGLVKQGKIRYWGLSNFTGKNVQKHVPTKQDARIAGTEDFFNLASTRRDDAKLMSVIRKFGLGLLAFSPQREGQLSPGRKENQRFPGLVSALDQVAGELKATRPQVCIAWVLSHPQVSSVLGGAESPEHVIDNFAGVQLKLPKEAIALLNQARKKVTR